MTLNVHRGNAFPSLEKRWWFHHHLVMHEV